MAAIEEEIIKAIRNGNKILVCGNGGSAAEADHFVGELVCKFKKERRALPAISLNNPTIITAIGNDYGFQFIFSRQIEALGKEGDILITLSTSGTSTNILEAHKAAKKLGLKVIAFPTNKDLNRDTAWTQEVHLAAIHNVAGKIEEAFL